MGAGQVPKEVAPYRFGGNLFALLKKSGGLQPVAVGDVLRRLTYKCLACSVLPKAPQLPRPLQSGVGVKEGSEAVVHATRARLAQEDIQQPFFQEKIFILY